MSKPLYKFIEKVACLVIFVCAISMLFRLTASVSLMAREQRSVVFEKADGALTAGTDLIGYNEPVVVSYNEVIAMLLDGIEYDVRVGGKYLSHNYFVPAEFEYSLIEPCNYEKTYRYSSDGSIRCVTFTKIE